MNATTPSGSTLPLLDVVDLEVRYRLRSEVVRAVRSVSLRVGHGEIVAIVGESGSGKSTTAHAVLGLLPPTAEVVGGRIDFAGQDLAGLSERQFRSIRGREIALIPQDPHTSLNPVLRIGVQVAEVLRVHGLADRRDARVAAVRKLTDAGLPDAEIRARQYPSQLSGGMCQRALIATAIAAGPRLIVADEPTSALDVTVQRQILDHIEGLTRTSGTSVLLITHDLGVAAERADRIVVMRAGAVVEEGTPEEILSCPREPYTRALLDAAPSLARQRSTRRSTTTVGRAVIVAGAPGDPFAGSGSAAPPAHPEGPHVRVEHLVKEFPLPRTANGANTLRAVDDVSFAIRRGETFALVGESGSGKSTVARTVLRLVEPTGGRVFLDGEDVTTAKGAAKRQLRRRMQVVYQNPFASLNPRMTIEQIVTDPLVSFGMGTRADRRRRAAHLVDLVALPATTLGRRPAELSGGQRQRVAIARALALNPGLVVCDEPVSALDVSIQAQILDLLVDLQEQLGLSYLFISHDLAVVRQIAHEVGVMRAGRMVENGPTEQLFAGPRHPYTQELLASIPGHRNRSTTAPK